MDSSEVHSKANSLVDVFAKKLEDANSIRLKRRQLEQSISQMVENRFYRKTRVDDLKRSVSALEEGLQELSSMRHQLLRQMGKMQVEVKMLSGHFENQLLLPNTTLESFERSVDDYCERVKDYFSSDSLDCDETYFEDKLKEQSVCADLCANQNSELFHLVERNAMDLYEFGVPADKLSELETLALLDLLVFFHKERITSC